MEPFWTEGRIAMMLKLLAEGHSAESTGNYIGCSRNAVIGKVHRLERETGQQFARKRMASHSVRKPVIAPGTRVKAAFPMKAVRPAPKPRRGVEELDEPAVPLPAPVLKMGHACGILELTGCKFAVGEDASVVGRHLFCNAEKHDERYCAFHAAEAAAPYSAKLIKKTILQAASALGLRFEKRRAA